jgi:hypothetical protein
VGKEWWARKRIQFYVHNIEEGLRRGGGGKRE